MEEQKADSHEQINQIITGEVSEKGELKTTKLAFTIVFGFVTLFILVIAIVIVTLITKGQSQINANRPESPGQNVPEPTANKFTGNKFEWSFEYSSKLTPEVNTSEDSAESAECNFEQVTFQEAKLVIIAGNKSRICFQFQEFAEDTVYTLTSADERQFNVGIQKKEDGTYTLEAVFKGTQNEDTVILSYSDISEQELTSAKATVAAIISSLKITFPAL